MLKKLPKKFSGFWLLLVLAVLLPASAAPLSIFAASAKATRDCSSSAVITCGAMTSQGLINKYTGDTNIAHIYDYFDISPADVLSMNSTAAAGTVTKNGEVTAGGKTVAIQAVIAQRTKAAGSLSIGHKGAEFYVRPASVFVKDNSEPAYVVMKNGRFDFAVLAAGGNPVKARAVSQAQAGRAEPVTSSAVTSTPVLAASGRTPAFLPRTGIGSLLAIFLITAAAGTSAHYVFSRKARTDEV